MTDPTKEVFGGQRKGTPLLAWTPPAQAYSEDSRGIAGLTAYHLFHHSLHIPL